MEALANGRLNTPLKCRAGFAGPAGSTPAASAPAPVVKRTSFLASNETFQVRFLVGVLRNSPVVQRPGRSPDVGNIGGSSPPGTTDDNGRISRWATAPGRTPGERQRLAGSTPAPSAFCDGVCGVTAEHRRPVEPEEGVRLPSNPLTPTWLDLRKAPTSYVGPYWCKSSRRPCPPVLSAASASRPFDGQQSCLCRPSSGGGEPAGLATGGHDPMTRDDQSDRVPPQRLSDGPGRAGPPQRSGKLPVGPGLSRRDLTGGLVHPPRERRRPVQVNGHVPKILDVAAEVPAHLLDDLDHSARRLGRRGAPDFRAILISVFAVVVSGNWNRVTAGGAWVSSHALQAIPQQPSDVSKRQ